MPILVHRETDAGREEISRNAGVMAEFEGAYIRFNTKQSRYGILIQADAFGEVARAMIEANPSEAKKALSAALSAAP